MKAPLFLRSLASYSRLNLFRYIPTSLQPRTARTAWLTSEKSDSLGPKLGARAFRGKTWRKAKWNETAQNSKTEGGIERKNKKM